MKVLVLPAWYPSADKPQHGDFVYYQTRELVRRGVEAAVLYVDFDFRYFFKSARSRRWTTSFEVEDGIPTFRLRGADWPKATPALLRRWARRYAQLYEHYERRFGRPDLLHAHTCFGGLAALELARRIDVPYVVTENSSALLADRIRPWWKPLIRQAYQHAAEVFAVSPRFARHLETRYAGRAVSVMPNFINMDLFPLRAEAKSSATFTFLAAGSLIPRKGFDVLLHAFARVVRAEQGKALLKILGEGPERERLIRLVHQLGLDQYVSLPGACANEQMPDKLRAADALVLPSHDEPFGIILIEAMATGLPVVATRSGGPEYIVTPETGLLVPPGDPDALAAAMRDLLRERARFQPAVIRSYAERNFGAEAVASKWVAIYRRIAASGG